MMDDIVRVVERGEANHGVADAGPQLMGHAARQQSHHACRSSISVSVAALPGRLVTASVVAAESLWGGVSGIAAWCLFALYSALGLLLFFKNHNFEYSYY